MDFRIRFAACRICFGLGCGNQADFLREPNHVYAKKNFVGGAQAEVESDAAFHPTKESQLKWCIASQRCVAPAELLYPKTYGAARTCNV